MLKKYTSNKYFSLTENNDNHETSKIRLEIQKITTKITPKLSEEKKESQMKNTILLKNILKSNSIIKNNTNENILINKKNKNKMSSKKAKQKPKNQIKAKIKTTFSNYFTDYLFKNSLNNNPKQNINNFTEITYKPEENEELNEINITCEKTLKANSSKYSGFYHTDSSNKIHFKKGININKSKDFSPFKKGSIKISPKNYKKIIPEEKMENVNNSSAKVQKIIKEKIVENSKNLIYINNLSESNHLNNSNNISKSNKNMKKFKEVYKKNKINLIKKIKTNNLNQKKKQNIKKMSEKNIKRNKQNKIIEYEGKASNKTSNKINIHNVRKHIFLPQMLKKEVNLDKNRFPSKKLEKIEENNFYRYKANNSTSIKDMKKILFTFNESRNKTKPKKFNKFSKISFNNNIKKEKQTSKESPLKKENNSTIKSEDKNTEKDFNLENKKIIEKNAKTNSKNLIDYFKMARKLLKHTSHSLVESKTNNNNFYEDIEIRNKINQAGQITNRINYTENDEDSNYYTIKKVPIFSVINMFPSKKNKNDIKNFLYKIFIKNNNNNIIKYIIFFLDVKSIIIISSLNKDFFKNLRSVFYKTLFNILYKNKNIKLIQKLNNSLIKSVSAQYKSDIFEATSTQTSYIDIILNDIDRTFPNDSRFQKGGKNHQKLYNVLTKYSNYNKDIGYAQGLNFLFANALLLYQNEKDAFFYIDGMIKKFKLKKFFAEKNSKLTEEIGKFSKILEKYIPEIVNFFEKKFIYHEFFSTGWILTLFSNAMQPTNLFICWNFLNILGWKFFYCFVIQILRYYKQIIFRTNENELSRLMKNLLKDKKFSNDLPVILKNTFIFMQKHILL